MSFPNAIHNTNFSLVVVVGVVNIIEQWNTHRQANANVHKYDMFGTNLTKMLFKTLCSSVFFCSKKTVVLPSNESLIGSNISTIPNFVMFVLMLNLMNLFIAMYSLHPNCIEAYATLLLKFYSERLRTHCQTSQRH